MYTLIMNAGSERTDSKSQGSNPAVNSVTSSELLGPAKQLFISHNGDKYTLRITANNKLLLTK